MKVLTSETWPEAIRTLTSISMTDFKASELTSGVANLSWSCRTIFWTSSLTTGLVGAPIFSATSVVHIGYSFMNA